MTKAKKKNYGKRFAPEFQPTYVDVIAVDDEMNHYRLQLMRPIEYTANQIRVYVRKP